MNTYTKVIGLTGSHYEKEFIKKERHNNKIREVSEATVIKQFKTGHTKVVLYFEEEDRKVELDSFSDPEDIRKFLGKSFI